MPSDSHRIGLELRRVFICEALDLARVHLDWVTRHLEEGRDERAIEAFERFLRASREAANEMKGVRAAVATSASLKAAAAEYRAGKAA